MLANTRAYVKLNETKGWVMLQDAAKLVKTYGRTCPTKRELQEPVFKTGGSGDGKNKYKSWSTSAVLPESQGRKYFLSQVWGAMSKERCYCSCSTIQASE